MGGMNRRRLLAATGLALIAGCSSGTDDGTETTATTATPSVTDTATPTQTRTRTTLTDMPPTETPVHADYETTTVVVRSVNGERLGAVTAAIADTSNLRYRGLSDTSSLPEDRGMLFVYDEAADRAFVMRRMDFGIDIVYADADRKITRIHHAPEPGPNEDGTNQRYPGYGQYVLEVNRGWTTKRGIAPGDVLEFEL